jgi:hypothetical protein
MPRNPKNGIKTIKNQIIQRTLAGAIRGGMRKIHMATLMRAVIDKESAVERKQKTQVGIWHE